MDTELLGTHTQPRKKENKPWYSYVALGVILGLAIIGFQFSQLFSSVEINESVTIEIPEGFSVSEVSLLLQEQGLIKSDFAFSIQNRIKPIVVKSGTYLFNPGEYTLEAIRNRLTEAEFGDIYIRITIPEGSNRNEIAEILSESELAINSQEFLQATTDLEGYLFPDTYFFLPGDTTEDVIVKFTQTFDSRREEISNYVEQSPRSFEDLVIMASIIEKEATSDIEEMRTVAGILWKRLDQGIPLQVDAPFLFAIGKGSEDLRISDLRRDGPYNTYTNKGLTPTPIGNPGLDALRAAADPLDSIYFFYLHDTNGGIHYGVTHDDHVRNKNRYLR